MRFPFIAVSLARGVAEIWSLLTSTLNRSLSFRLPRKTKQTKIAVPSSTHQGVKVCTELFSRHVMPLHKLRITPRSSGCWRVVKISFFAALFHTPKVFQKTSLACGKAKKKIKKKYSNCVASIGLLLALIIAEHFFFSSNADVASAANKFLTGVRRSALPLA